MPPNSRALFARTPTKRTHNLWTQPYDRINSKFLGLLAVPGLAEPSFQERSEGRGRGLQVATLLSKVGAWANVGRASEAKVQAPENVTCACLHVHM